jgi:hypothetical protein
MTRARSLPKWILSPFLTPSTAHSKTGQSLIKMWFDSMCSPQRGAYTVARFVLVFLLLSSPCFGQAWSNILSPSRAIDWTNAGLPSSFTDKGGGNRETTANPWTLPSRTQSGSTVNTISGTCDATHDCTSTINAALSSCPDGHYVLLGSGTFSIQGQVDLYAHSCDLRATSPTSTTLSVTGAGVIFLGAASSGGSITLTISPAAGATTLIGSSLSGAPPAVGAAATLNQCDTGYSGSPCGGSSVDNHGLYVCGDNSSCITDSPASGPQNHQFQTVVITSVTNIGGIYTLGISPSIYMPNWSTSRSATLSWNAASYSAVGAGLSDMSIYSSGVSGNETVQVNNCYACWIKGVRFVGTAAVTPLYFLGAISNSLLSNNYFFSDIALDGGYPPSFQFQGATATLVLNNISASGVPGVGEGNNVGDVWAYNYGRDTFTMYLENNLFDHHAYSSLMDYEGNESGAATEDDTWGTHGLNTYFRNIVFCWDPPYSTYSGGVNARGLQADNYHRMENFVGNAVGNLNYCSTYQGSGYGTVFRIATGDSLVASTLLRWGNVSVVQQSSDTPSNSGVRFVSSEVPSSLASPISSFLNPVPSNNTLPCSFFLAGYTSTSCTAHPSGGTGLSWWKVCTTWSTFPTSCSTTQAQPFPAAGPDVSGGTYVNGYAYDIPASVAWQNLPVDTTYQNSYTITGSSWSGGTETLAISGLPNTTHLMGAFQLNGVSAACTSGATFNASSEILMTGSSSTTVKYALASDPGISCTGTMKFPDVRQFDERVYMADGSGVGDPPPPAPPTNVTATVE